MSNTVFEALSGWLSRGVMAILGETNLVDTAEHTDGWLGARSAVPLMVQYVVGLAILMPC
jgi:hypothetical protein